MRGVLSVLLVFVWRRCPQRPRPAAPPAKNGQPAAAEDVEDINPKRTLRAKRTRRPSQFTRPDFWAAVNRLVVELTSPGRPLVMLVPVILRDGNLTDTPPA